MSRIMLPFASGDSGWLVILGPPGCGKTMELLTLLGAELEKGTPPDRIAFVSFTRAARAEVLSRVKQLFNLDAGDMPWLRTIHSAAYRLSGLRRGMVMTRIEWQKFAEAYRYDLSDLSDMTDSPDEAQEEPPRRTKDDLLRYVYEWGRNRRLDVERSMGRCPALVPATQFRLFVSRLEDFKRQNGLLDFTDVLDRVLDNDLRPNVDVAFIDEAQDLSPLQIAVVEQWFGGCKRVYAAGDEDQAIYSFQGAEPDWMLSLAKRYPTVILSQSHRIPATVHSLAQLIIRCNRKRIPKTYRPTAQNGKVEYLPFERAMEQMDGKAKTLVLARNRMFLKPVAEFLFESRIPYVVEGRGGKSPLSSTTLVRAVKAACQLWHSEPLDAGDLNILLEHVPSRGANLLPHGVKTQAASLTGDVSTEDMRGLGLGAMLEAIRRDGPISVFLKLRPSYRAYIQALLDRYGLIPKPEIRLTSIHAAKGQEADLVVVLPDMTRATYLEHSDGAHGGYEAENRVAYVAVTRAKNHLIVVQPKTRRYYDYRSAGKTGEQALKGG